MTIKGTFCLKQGTTAYVRTLCFYEHDLLDNKAIKYQQKYI